jgi:N-acetylglucosaminyl-diphospho-decaprenol L-rhamnosyltransferase
MTSIVVVTWNCSHHLEALVRSMNRHLDGRQELVVVDNASADDPEQASRRWRGRGVFERLPANVGFGAAANRGVELAGGEAVVILNPDTELVDASLDELATFVLELGVLAGPRVLEPDGSWQASASGPEVGIWPWVRALFPGALTPQPVVRRTEPSRSKRRVRVTWLTGCCIAAPREVLRALGPFDPSLHLYGEDLDLGLRAQAHGVASYFCPDACRIVHLGSGSSAQRYGSAEGWRVDGALNWRAVLRRAYGARKETAAWRALKLNLALRSKARAALRSDAARTRAARAALRAARAVPELPPP